MSGDGEVSPLFYGVGVIRELQSPYVGAAKFDG
jgi:hypothetical protein